MYNIHFGYRLAWYGKFWEPGLMVKLCNNDRPTSWWLWLHGALEAPLLCIRKLLSFSSIPSLIALLEAQDAMRKWLLKARKAISKQLECNYGMHKEPICTGCNVYSLFLLIFPSVIFAYLVIFPKSCLPPAHPTIIDNIGTALSPLFRQCTYCMYCAYSTHSTY